MTIRTHTAPSDAALAGYLEGELPPLQNASVEQALTCSLDARLRLEQLTELRTALSAPLPQLDRVDLVSGVRRALAQPQRGRLAYSWSGSIAMAALCLGLGTLWSSQRDEASSELRVKAAASHPAGPQTHAGIQVYRVRGHDRAELLGAELGQSDGLLFAYTNAGDRPFKYLMLFGVDASRQVRWYYPAYERADSDPSALPIAEDQLQTLLPDVVRHDYGVGALTLYALFTRAPLHVSQVERWLAQQALQPASAPLPDALLKPRKLEVTP